MGVFIHRGALAFFFQVSPKTKIGLTYGASQAKPPSEKGKKKKKKNPRTSAAVPCVEKQHRLRPMLSEASSI